MLDRMMKRSAVSGGRVGECKREGAGGGCGGGFHGCGFDFEEGKGWEGEKEGKGMEIAVMRIL